jgi:hypothetical protein
VELRQYYQGKTPTPAENQALIQSNRGEFIKVEDEPAYGDLIVLNLSGLECHIGIFIKPEKFLHSIEGKGSVLDNIERYKHRIVGYYRHKGKAS